MRHVNSKGHDEHLQAQNMKTCKKRDFLGLAFSSQIELLHTDIKQKRMNSKNGF